MKHNKYRLLYSSALVLSPLMSDVLGDVAESDEQSHYADRYGADAQGQDSILNSIETSNAQLRETVRKTIQKNIQLEGISTDAADTLHTIIIAGITGSVAGIEDLEEHHAAAGADHADLTSFLQQLQAWLTGSYSQHTSQALNTLKSTIAAQYPSWNIAILTPEMPNPNPNTDTIYMMGTFEADYGNALGLNVPISSNLAAFIGNSAVFKLVNQETQTQVDGVKITVKQNEIKVVDLDAGTYILDISANTKTDRYDLVVRPKKLSVIIKSENKVYTGTTNATLNITVTGILDRDVKDVQIIATGTFPRSEIGTYTVTVSDYRVGGAKRHNYTLLPWTGTLNASILKGSATPGNPSQDTSTYVTMNPISSSTPTFTGTCEAGATVQVTFTLGGRRHNIQQPLMAQHGELLQLPYRR